MVSQMCDAQLTEVEQGTDISSWRGTSLSTGTLPSPSPLFLPHVDILKADIQRWAGVLLQNQHNS